MTSYDINLDGVEPRQMCTLNLELGRAFPKYRDKFQILASLGQGVKVQIIRNPKILEKLGHLIGLTRYPRERIKQYCEDQGYT